MRVKVQLHYAIYRLRFYSNSLIHILSHSNSHNNVASIQKNRGDKSHRVIVALLRDEIEKATATKYIFLIVFRVLPRFNEKMNKRPGKNSKNLISAQGAYSNHYSMK